MWQSQWNEALTRMNRGLIPHRFSIIEQLRQEFLIATRQILESDGNIAKELMYLLQSYEEAVSIVANAYLFPGEIGVPEEEMDS